MERANSARRTASAATGWCSPPAASSSTAAHHDTALIGGYIGVYAGPSGVATVTNFGTLRGRGGVAVQFKSAGDRLIAEAGSTFLGVAQGGGGALELANGIGTITGLGASGTLSGAEALIFSGFGSYAIDAGASWTLVGTNALAAGQSLTHDGTVSLAGSLSNAGAITGGAGGAGLSLAAGGVLVNTASIKGLVGVRAGGSGAATVTNFGTIEGTGGVAVQFKSAADRLIAETGSTFVGVAQGGGGTLELAGGVGTIAGAGGTATLTGAIALTSSGFGSYAIDAGSWTVTGALALSGGVTVGGTLINQGSITSALGVYAGPSGAATVTNFGTIEGTGGVAVQFKSSADRLIAQAGSTLIGAAAGGGGTLELAGGTGTITGLGTSGTLSGADAMTFSGFGTYVIDAGSYWTLSGTNILAVSQSLRNDGALTLAGSLTNNGAISGKTGALGGSGADGGAGGVGLDLAGGANLLNIGTIIAGTGGTAGFNAVGGAGGNGVDVAVGASFSNAGSITAGGGGANIGVDQAGAGGVGVVLAGAGSFSNSGTITGGSGGNGASYFGVGGAEGGAGATLAAGADLINSGAITGGSGGYGYYHRAGGGCGVTLADGASLSNMGRIAGGSGNSAGATLASGASLSNSGTITGGGAGWAGLGVFTMRRVPRAESACPWRPAGAFPTPARSTAAMAPYSPGAARECRSRLPRASPTPVRLSPALGARPWRCSWRGRRGRNDGGGGRELVQYRTGHRRVWRLRRPRRRGGFWDRVGCWRPPLQQRPDHRRFGRFGRVRPARRAPAESACLGGRRERLQLRGHHGRFGRSWRRGLESRRRGRRGWRGVEVSAGGSVINYGAIMGGLGGVGGAGTKAGPAGAVGDGVASSTGGIVTNGSATIHSALISGAVGVYAGPSGATTVTNFATIEGTGGVSVQFKSASDRLIAEAGSTCIGAVAGGGGTLELAGGAGTITGLGASGTISGAVAMTFGGFGSYVIDAGGFWTLAGANSVTAAQSLTVAGSLTVADGASLGLQGTVVNSGRISLAATAGAAILSIGGAGATLTGAGSVTLGNDAGNGITGSGVLTNFNDTISGSGLIGGGSLSLVNGAFGSIVGQGAVGLTLDTGSNTISNSGLIEATKGGAVTVKSAVANNGVLEALKGVLTLNGAVTGTGSAKINGGTLDFASSFQENVAFVGKTGKLELAQSQAYAGAVSGFSKSGQTSLDLVDIGFVGAGEATFSGTTSSGVLTVSDGTHTAKIHLTGDYTGATFTASSDGQGGVSVTASGGPAAANAAIARPAATHPLIAAMASLGGSGGEGVRAAGAWPTHERMLAAPHVMVA